MCSVCSQRKTENWECHTFVSSSSRNTNQTHKKTFILSIKAVVLVVFSGQHLGLHTSTFMSPEAMARVPPLTLNPLTPA